MMLMMEQTKKQKKTDFNVIVHCIKTFSDGLIIFQNILEISI